MIKYGVVSASALLIGLGACTNKDAPIIESNTIEYKTEQVQTAVSVVPDWFKEMPEHDRNIYSAGTATAPDIQLAIDVATLNAKTVLADRINGKLDSMTKSFVAKIGQSDIDTSVLTEIETVTKNVIASVDVAGYSQVKLDVLPAGTQYRAFVLLEYSDIEATKIMMNRLRKDRMIYSRIRSTKAWEELEREVQSNLDDEQAESVVNIEKIITAGENEKPSL
jgi:hypothetical protein|tara:strand:+ start:1071 stop:1736 length:666 start_codon:yes stop_codon:yes gene_type:complete